MLAVAILSVGNFNFILPIAAGHIEQNNSWNLIILTNKKKKKQLMFITFFLSFSWYSLQLEGFGGLHMFLVLNTKTKLFT